MQLTVLTRVSHFMVWPLVTLILSRDLEEGPAQIGLYMTLAMAASLLIGAFFGGLSDRVGRTRILGGGLLLTLVSFVILTVIDNAALLYVGVFLNSLAKGLIEPISNSIISNSSKDRTFREKLLKRRYFLMNVGAAIGPVIGIFIGYRYAVDVFTVAGLVTLTMFVRFLWVTLGAEKVAPDESDLAKEGLNKNGLKNALLDKPFMLLLLCNICVMAVYGQIDITLPQVLSTLLPNDPTGLLSLMLTLNAAIIILLQFPLDKLLSVKSLSFRANFGITLLALSQAIFLLADSGWLYWIVGVVILSVGEVVLFPTISIKVDRLAPNNMKGAYFGVAQMYEFGFAISPLVGGLLLSEFGMLYLWGGMTVLTLAVLALYQLINLLERNNNLKGETNNGI
ncbi:hypothetical protein CWI84_02285 [Idiomarina tyrosinivorans]|uniref:Major facilitator superfamily (MFS) profile domain-containing protein n=2 Tax=Idiomarina tyrosinivorans TaxID=1445662 RepID=A0A432ZSV7_9GAMM|nr:hypothetical protein CWI84_02285 [Idiomarina tyrosinivorans]